MALALPWRADYSRAHRRRLRSQIYLPHRKQSHLSTATAICLGGSVAAPLVQRVLRFPLTRILLAVVFVMVPFLRIQ